MSSLSLKVLVAIVVTTFAFAAPADATKAPKHKKVAVASPAAQPQHRGTNLFPAGPVYFADVYLGDDPDPNIRFQLLREISARLGGEN